MLSGSSAQRQMLHIVTSVVGLLFDGVFDEDLIETTGKLSKSVRFHCHTCHIIFIK